MSMSRKVHKMSGGPSDPKPEGWRNGTRAFAPSTRNRKKILNHIRNTLAWAVLLKEAVQDEGDVHRHASDLSEYAKHLRRHIRRTEERLRAETEFRKWQQKD